MFCIAYHANPSSPLSLWLSVVAAAAAGKARGRREARMVLRGNEGDVVVVMVVVNGDALGGEGGKG